MTLKEKFIDKMIKKFGNKFDFTDTNYLNSKTYVEIKCENNHIFGGIPNKILTYKIPCDKCRKEYQLKINKHEFLIKANITHNNRYIYPLDDYINNKQKIKILCSVHGVFYMRPDLHIYQKQGCPNCYIDTLITVDKLKEKANKVHNNIYDYSNITKIPNDYIIEIICNKHGKFTQNMYNHLTGQGCPLCNNSKGENVIERYLIENNISYIKQKKFEKCKNKRCLPFDFYLPEKNTCIEYDGYYHFIGNVYIENNDNIKNIYCQENGIKLIRINLSNINKLDFLL